MLAFIYRFTNSNLEKQYLNITLEKQSYSALLNQPIGLNLPLGKAFPGLVQLQVQVDHLKRSLDALAESRQKIRSITWWDYLVQGEACRQHYHLSKQSCQSLVKEIDQHFLKIRMMMLAIVMEYREKSGNFLGIEALIELIPSGPIKDYYLALAQKRSAFAMSPILYDKNRYLPHYSEEQYYVRAMHHYRQGEHDKAKKICAWLADQHYAPALYFWGNHFAKYVEPQQKKTIELEVFAYASAAVRGFIPAIVKLVKLYIEHLMAPTESACHKLALFEKSVSKVMTQEQFVILFVNDVLNFDFYDARDLVAKLEMKVAAITNKNAQNRTLLEEKLIRFYRHIIEKQEKLHQEKYSATTASVQAYTGTNISARLLEQQGSLEGNATDLAGLVLVNK